jgi:transcriptional regulator with XRE-family HTH domain
MEPIKEKIKRIRRGLGWTQKQLADELGKTRATIGHYETGHVMPSAETYERILSLDPKRAA